MSFHDDLFPEQISRGSSGGPAFRTIVTESDAGVRYTNQKWSGGRLRYDVSYGVRSANSFPFKDHIDCHSNPTNPSYLAIPGIADQACSPATGNGVLTTFQLVKTYVSGSQVATRIITLPVTSTIRVWVNGVEQIGNWAVSRDGGIITFTAPVSNGATVTWSGYFHVRVFFDEDAESGMMASIDGWDAGGIEDIMLVEDLSAAPANIGEFFYGGADDRVISAPITLSTSAFLYRISASVGSLYCQCPDPTNLPLGGNYFLVMNAGANTFTVRNHSGVTIATLTTNQAVYLALTANGGGVKSWYAIGA
jgi:uncharacterized protein (TIGR02217 family)